MKNFVELFHQFGKLKNLKRKGWILRKVPSPESVAEHTYRTTLMALVLSENLKLNTNKCVQMALIHDIAESVVGDITPHDNWDINKKYQLEKNAIIQIFSEVDGKDILKLWEEYEKNESREAKFVRELDLFEMVMQAQEYEEKYNDIDLSEFWKYVEQRLHTPQLLEMVKLLKQEKENSNTNSTKKV